MNPMGMFKFSLLLQLSIMLPSASDKPGGKRSLTIKIKAQ